MNPLPFLAEVIQSYEERLSQAEFLAVEDSKNLKQLHQEIIFKNTRIKELIKENDIMLVRKLALEEAIENEWKPLELSLRAKIVELENKETKLRDQFQKHSDQQRLRIEDLEAQLKHKKRK